MYNYFHVYLQDLFADEIKKHDAYLGYIRQNLAAQDNILTAVTEANVNYARVNKTVEAHKSKYVIYSRVRL